MTNFLTKLPFSGFSEQTQSYNRDCIKKIGTLILFKKLNSFSSRSGRKNDLNMAASDLSAKVIFFLITKK